jgi:peroxiredoxin
MTDGIAMPSAGQIAPKFSLPSGPDTRISLDDLRGGPIILAFYPADWSPVCSDQMSLYQAVLPEFQRHHARLVGISVDGVWCHQAFADSHGIEFPLLADFEPKGAVAQRYGVYEADKGTSARALFVLDAAGVIAWSYLSPGGVHGVNPGADGILAVLETLDKRSVTT